MKVFHNIFKHISSNHQDKHPDKVNSHQHHGKVDKKHRSKIVEIDKMDKHSQIDNDFGLHIIYFLQHGCWNVTEHSPQIEKIWFYNSEPSIDIKEYNSFADNTTDTFIFTIIPDNNHVIKLSSPITVTIERRDGYYFINFSGDKSDIIYKVDGFSIKERNFFTLLSGNFKPDWRWAVSKATFPKEKFDSYVESVFSKIDFYKQCGVINPQNANTAYFGDTDGRVGAVLYALLVSGHIGIREKGWSLLCDLLEHEDMASFAYENKKLGKLFTLLDKRDMFLNELHQHVFLKCDAITPCIFLGDHTGDRFSTIFGDKYILTLLNSMRNMEGNKDSRINKNVVVLAGNHEINFNGNYSARLANHKLSSGDTYNLIKTLDVCNYDSERHVLTSHHGIIRDEENKCYCLGALQVPFNQMKNPTDPEELAYIFNKKHKQHMDDHLFHLIRINTMEPTPVYADYLNNTTDFRPARERIFICGETLKCEDPSKHIRQKYGHHGLGVNQNQKIDDIIMGLNSKMAVFDENKKIIGSSSGLSCFQPR
ncbi:YhiJ/YhiL family protein [Escherichia coli]|nr:YhiJ/YhiL family protein [Escherichia coli]